MPAINDIQAILENLLQKPVPQSEIARALGTGRANISLRIKNRSEIQINEIRKLENYFNVSLAAEPKELDYRKIQPNYDNPYYIKSVQILNSAGETELEAYFGAIKQCRKIIELVKNH